MSFKKIRVVIAGWQPKSAHLPNLSQHSARAVMASPDMELVAIVSRNPERVTEDIKDRPDLPRFLMVLGYDDLFKLKGKADLALLAIPSEHIKEIAPRFLELGICTADSFDDHAVIPELRAHLMSIAKKHNAVAAMSFGWEPGLLSGIRTALKMAIPDNVLKTTYGGAKGGRSLGHSAVAREALRAIIPQTNALSITYAGVEPGLHNRLVVYIDSSDENKDQCYKALRKTLKFTPKDSRETLSLICVPHESDLKAYDTNCHGCVIHAANPEKSIEMTIDFSTDGPEVTSNCLLAAGRAAVRRSRNEWFGCLTPIEIAPIELLPGDDFDDRVKENKDWMI